MGTKIRRNSTENNIRRERMAALLRVSVEGNLRHWISGPADTRVDACRKGIDPGSDPVAAAHCDPGVAWCRGPKSEFLKCAAHATPWDPAWQGGFRRPSRVYRRLP